MRNLARHPSPTRWRHRLIHGMTRRRSHAAWPPITEQRSRVFIGTARTGKTLRAHRTGDSGR